MYDHLTATLFDAHKRIRDDIANRDFKKFINRIVGVVNLDDLPTEREILDAISGFKEEESLALFTQITYQVSTKRNEIMKNLKK